MEECVKKAFNSLFHIVRSDQFLLPIADPMLVPDDQVCLSHRVNLACGRYMVGAIASVAYKFFFPSGWVSYSGAWCAAIAGSLAVVTIDSP
eukprot:IDg14334t1